jgi:peptide-methionine (S)-S-oxide reductase
MAQYFGSVIEAYRMKPELQAHETLTLGGGCFWCTEAVYKRVTGVVDVESGYCNGQTIDPSYEQVCSGGSGHAEVVKLVYDPGLVTVRELLEIFFFIHDPTTLNFQGHDQGTQYRSGIYFTSPHQQQVAMALIDELKLAKAFNGPIVTEVSPQTNYWAAEAYHQDYFERNPYQGYCLAVVAPKVVKLRKVFARLLRD